MNIYLQASALVFLFLGLMWTRKDWINLLAKALFLGFGGWALFLAFELGGYIIKK